MIFLYIFIINFLLITAKNGNEFDNGIEESDLFTRFHRYNNIISYLWDLNRKYPDQVTVIPIGTTYEDRDMFAYKISAQSYDEDKPIILIDAGIHAREWMTTAVALYIIRQLLENNNLYLIQTVDWIIVPVLNPDGYEFSHNKLRLWRKNRYQGRICNGVDLNRNFDFHWGQNGASRNECYLNYRGPAPFSEPETRALRDLVLRYQKNIKLSVSLHSFGQKLVYPWGYVDKTTFDDFEYTHYQLGLLVAKAINTMRNIQYSVGRLSSMLYITSGSSSDWMLGAANIPLCYVIEMNNDTYKFTPPAKEILPTATEIFEGFKEYHKYVQTVWNVVGNKNHKNKNRKQAST